MGWEMGLEPTTPGTTIRCSNQLSYTHHITDARLRLKLLARLEGLEPPAHCLEGSCSIHLSYRRISNATPIGSQYSPEYQTYVERVMGIEPTRPAWKAGILPLNYTRKFNALLLYHIIRQLSRAFLIFS